jgi:hypothetical protein
MAKQLTPILVLVVMVLAVALVMSGGKVMTAMTVLTAHPSTFNLTAGNVSPTMTTPVCYQTNGTPGAIGAIALTGNSSIAVTCTTNVTDLNGCSDFNGTLSGNVLNGSVHEDTVNDDCSANNLNCYVNAACTAVGTCADGISQFVNCTYANIWWNADNTSASGWDGYMSIADSAGKAVSNKDTDLSVSALLAIHVDHWLDFGSIAAGTNQTTCAVDHNTWNYGNVIIDLHLEGTTLDCPAPYLDIPVGYLKYNSTDDAQDYSTVACTALTTGPVKTEFDLGSSTTTSGEPAATTDLTYWGVGTTVGSGGVCTSTVTFTAVAD